MDLTTPCIPWDGEHRAHDGRPMLGRRYAYRVLYEEQVGPIPDGHILHHGCENHWCVNVRDHVEPITQGRHIALHGLPGDNHQAAKTHCPSGHPYDDENTYVYRRGDSVERHCKTCRRATKRRYRQRLAAQKGW